MDYPTQPVKWTNADHDLPSKEEYGPYPTVIVATQYVNHPQWGFGQEIAQLRYLGENPSRPIWLKPDGRTPIENEAVAVCYWTKMLTPPGGN